MTSSHQNKTTSGRYFFLISNNGNEVDMESTFHKPFNFNTTLSFKCNGGFILPDKNDNCRICQQNETWSGMEPTCNVKHLLLSQ